MSNELKWFNVIKRDLALMEDSIIFNIENPFNSQEMNFLLSKFRKFIKDGLAPRTCVINAFKELSIVYPKSQLKQVLSANMGFVEDFKSYEEQLYDDYGKRLFQRLGDELVHSTQSNVPLSSYIQKAKNTIDEIDGGAIRKEEINKDKATDLILQKWQKMLSRDYSDYIKTGIDGLDEVIIGLEKSKHMIIGARPSIGKTALGLSIMNNVASAGIKTAFVSVETLKQGLMERLAFINSEVPAEVFTNPELMNQEHYNNITNSLNMIRTNEDFIIESSVDRKITNVCRIIRTLKRQNEDLELVLVDYLQKTQATDTKQSKHLQIEDCSAALTDLAKSLDIRLITLAQLNRESEKDGKESLPSLYNFEGSSSIEKDADIAVLIHRSRKGALEAATSGRTSLSVFDEQSEQDESCLDTLLYIAKNRDGKTGFAKCSYNSKCTKFYSYEQHNKNSFGGF